MVVAGGVREAGAAIAIDIIVLTRLFSCENAKVANNFAEISSKSTFQLSSNRLTLSIDEAIRMH